MNGVGAINSTYKQIEIIVMNILTGLIIMYVKQSKNHNLIQTQLLIIDSHTSLLQIRDGKTGPGPRAEPGRARAWKSRPAGLTGLMIF